uniref:Uncharacterized protein n=1 Tax=Arundo donax TaxID=35708 RepID=A0A0A8Y487_ARUDO
MFESDTLVGMLLLSSKTKPNTSDIESPPIELISEFSRNLRIVSRNSSGYFISTVLNILLAHIPVRFTSDFSVARDALIQ